MINTHKTFPRWAAFTGLFASAVSLAIFLAVWLLAVYAPQVKGQPPTSTAGLEFVDTITESRSGPMIVVTEENYRDTRDVYMSAELISMIEATFVLLAILELFSNAEIQDPNPMQYVEGLKAGENAPKD